MDRREDLRRELDGLISTGLLLLAAEGLRTATPVRRNELLQSILKKMPDSSMGSPSPGGSSRSASETISKTAKTAGGPRKGAKATADSGQASKGATKQPDIGSSISLHSDYQGWYSGALKAVEQLLPDRYKEFQDLYQVERRKAIDVENYGIADYLSGITVTRLGVSEFDTGVVVLTKLHRQLAILISGKSRLDLLLANIKGVLEASLFDHELAAAKELLHAKHLRAGGVVAGVVLERHLEGVLASNKVTLRKKHQLGNMNEALKEAGVIDVPQWRQLQYLSDVRNLCAHSAGREPRHDEVADMIDGVAKIVKTLF